MSDKDFFREKHSQETLEKRSNEVLEDVKPALKKKFRARYKQAQETNDYLDDLENEIYN